MRSGCSQRDRPPTSEPSKTGGFLWCQFYPILGLQLISLQ
jgi:hypothetical protein